MKTSRWFNVLKNFTIIEYIYYKVSTNSEFVHVLERNRPRRVLEEDLKL